MQLLILFAVVAAAFGCIYYQGNSRYQKAIANWLKSNGCVAVDEVKRMNPFQDKYVRLEIRDAQLRRFLVELQVRGLVRGSYYQMARVVTQREVPSKSL